jgi:hypothetical protein
VSLAFREELISQMPAPQLLMALGYTYIRPEKAPALRTMLDYRMPDVFCNNWLMVTDSCRMVRRGACLASAAADSRTGAEA